MKHTLALFLKTGCVVCIFLLLCLAAVHHFKPALSSLPVFSRFERKLPIYCVDTDKPQVAISFDAAWGNEDTETLLSILDKYNVKTTFFMTGGWIESYPEDVKKIAASGHDLGNHSENTNRCLSSLPMNVSLKFKNLTIKSKNSPEQK